MALQSGDKNVNLPPPPSSSEQLFTISLRKPKIGSKYGSRSKLSLSRWGAVDEWSTALPVRENKRKPKDHRFLPGPGLGKLWKNIPQSITAERLHFTKVRLIRKFSEKSPQNQKDPRRTNFNTSGISFWQKTPATFVFSLRPRLLILLWWLRLHWSEW